MGRFRVEAPVEGFAGTVAGVAFDDGRAEMENSPALQYFRRAGYRVEPVRAKRQSKAPDTDGGDE